MEPDDLAVSVLIGYEALAAFSQLSRFRWSLPLITTMLMTGPRWGRWLFVAGLSLLMVLHLELT